MPIFTKGAVFTMGGKEYEVLAAGDDNPASCMLYVPRHEKDTADPLTIRMWKAEAKLARGDIMINSQPEDSASAQANPFYPPITDPLEQIAELKKRIQAIEQRRVILLKSRDPSGQILLQDNIIRPNRPFDIWTLAANGEQKSPIQYIRPRALILTISSNDNPEHFLFNIAGQIPPCCRAVDDVLSADGQVSLKLGPELHTIRGGRTNILTNDFAGRIELEIGLRLRCKYESGLTNLSAQIQRCSYIREVNSPTLKMDRLTFPEIGDHIITILGINVDIYTAGAKSQPVPLFPGGFPEI